MAYMYDVWQGVYDLNQRFGFNPNLGESIAIFMEEVGEVVQACQDEDAEHAAEEAADVIWTLINLLEVRGIDPYDLEVAVYEVVRKNGAKTHDTHELVDGKIRRKGKS